MRFDITKLRNKLSIKVFLAFASIFLLLFICTFKGGIDGRFWKSILSTIFFGILFAVRNSNNKEIFLSLLIGSLFYIGSAGTFTLYTEQLGVGWREVHYELFFAETLAVILLHCYTFRPLRWLSIIIEFAVGLLAFFEIIYYFLFKISVNADAIYILLQTNLAEVTDFLVHYILLTIVVLILLFTSFYLLVKCNYNLPPPKNSKYFIENIIYYNY